VSKEIHQIIDMDVNTYRCCDYVLFELWVITYSLWAGGTHLAPPPAID